MADLEKHFGIVVGVDGSGYSDEAVRWAAREAAMRELPLTLVQAVAIPAPAWPAAPISAELHDLYEADAQAILDDAVEIVEETSEGGVGTAEHQAPTALVWLVPNVWTICRKTRAWSLLRSWAGAAAPGVAGSVSTGLIHHADCL